MRVQSPVGEFPLSLVTARLERGKPTVEMAMGGWRSHVSLDRADIPLIAGLLFLQALVFAAGRMSAPRS